MNYLHFHFSFLITFCKHFSSDLRDREDPQNTVFLSQKGNGREFLCVGKKTPLCQSGLVWFCTAVMSWELGFDAV